MTWIDVALWAAILLGMAAAGFMFARSPSFWIEFGTALARKLWPFIFAYVTKRKSPEDETKWRDDKLSGQEPDRPKHR